MPDNIQLNVEKSRELSQRQNQAWFPNIIAEVQEDFGVKRVPIYIYNVGPLEHNTPRPPNHPHMFIKRCPIGEPYILAGQIEHPFPEIWYDQNNEQQVRNTNGYREATRMLSPMNPGTDQNWDFEGFSYGDNLNNYGVFWSVSNPPLPEELAAAKKRMEDTFRARLAKMVEIEAQEGPEGLAGRPGHVERAASNYFNQSYSWNRRDLVPGKPNNKVPCGACGEDISPNARICKECGAPTDPEKLELWLKDKFDRRHNNPGPNGR